MPSTTMNETPGNFPLPKSIPPPATGEKHYTQKRGNKKNKPKRPMSNKTPINVTSLTPLMLKSSSQELPPVFSPLPTPENITPIEIVNPTPVSMVLNTPTSPGLIMQFPSLSSSEKEEIKETTSKAEPMEGINEPTMSIPFPYIEPCRDFKQHEKWLSEFFQKSWLHKENTLSTTY